jgi:hypothetical protein
MPNAGLLRGFGKRISNQPSGKGTSLPTLPSAFWPEGAMFVDDDNGGTIYRSTGRTWEQVAPGVTQYGGVLLQRAENLTDVTCTSGTVAVDIPNLSFSVTKRAGRSLTVRWGGRVYNVTGGSGGVLQLYEDGVLIEDGCGWTSSVAFAFYYNTSEVVRDSISAGSHTYSVKLLALMNASPGTAHAWGAAAGTVSGSPRGRNATFLSVYES